MFFPDIVRVIISFPLHKFRETEDAALYRWDDGETKYWIMYNCNANVYSISPIDSFMGNLIGTQNNELFKKPRG